MVDTPSDRANTVVKDAAGEATETVVPLVEEEIAISKRVVPKSRVQVSRVTHSHEQLVDELLSRENVEIERTQMDRPVDAMPAVREEKDAIVIPVVEEVLKIERRLILKEEVRIRRVKGTERHQERVVLRKQEAVVNRLPVDSATAGRTDTRAGSKSDPKENP
jgi:uncharacterized protein (TIGR02271 family)